MGTAHERTYVEIYTQVHMRACVQVRQAVQDSREVNVVLHSLEDMQQLGLAGPGGASPGGAGGLGGDAVQHVHFAQVGHAGRWWWAACTWATRGGGDGEPHVGCEGWW